jgi:photosystem II stability/assembly factor-like uncharacterized protein
MPFHEPTGNASCASSPFTDDKTLDLSTSARSEPAAADGTPAREQPSGPFARPRSMRRLMVGLGLLALAGSSCSARPTVHVVGRSPRTPAATPSPVRTKDASAGIVIRTRSAARGRVVGDGKYVPSAVVRINGHDELATLAGFSFRGREPYAAWFDRSSDRGRSWQAVGTPSRSLSAPSSQQFIGFVTGGRGWAASPDLYWTDDGGRHWHLQFSAPHPVNSDDMIGSLVIAAGNAWIDRVQCRGQRCRNGWESIARPGAQPRPLAAQPAGRWETSLVRPSAATAYALGLDRDRPKWHFHLDVTTDAGRAWTTRPLPCGLVTSMALPVLAADRPGDLWLACNRFVGMSGDTSTIWHSADGGRRWARVSPRNRYDGVFALSPISAGVAWALGSDPNGYVTVLWTNDGGRDFTALLSDPARVSAGGFSARSATAATLTGWVPAGSGRREVVLSTRDGGRLWHEYGLPVASGKSRVEP